MVRDQPTVRVPLLPPSPNEVGVESREEVRCVSKSQNLRLEQSELVSLLEEKPSSQIGEVSVT